MDEDVVVEYVDWHGARGHEEARRHDVLGLQVALQAFVHGVKRQCEGRDPVQGRLRVRDSLMVDVRQMSPSPYLA